MHVFIGLEKDSPNFGVLPGGGVDAGSRCRGIARFDWLTRKKLDLPNKKSLFIGELVVVGAILEKFRQELEQSVPIVDKDPLHSH